ncbi:MAG: hypothetical protein ACF8R7_09590 [Phycisphaerales bacterium JB039]
MSGHDDIEKAALYAELGFGGDAAVYDEALAEAGLSGARKRRISLAKRERVRAELEARFLPVCNRGDCRGAAPAAAGGRQVVEASSPERCAICGGSATSVAVAEMVSACSRAGVRRLCIVGGSPEYSRQLRQLVGDALELRLIPGNVARTRKQADADRLWAQALVIWGPTMLDHKVSNLYTASGATGGAAPITLHRRSIQELAAAVTRAAESGAVG